MYQTGFHVPPCLARTYREGQADFTIVQERQMFDATGREDIAQLFPGIRTEFYRERWGWLIEHHAGKFKQLRSCRLQNGGICPSVDINGHVKQIGIREVGCTSRHRRERDRGSSQHLPRAIQGSYGVVDHVNQQSVVGRQINRGSSTAARPPLPRDGAQLIVIHCH